MISLEYNPDVQTIYYRLDGKNVFFRDQIVIKTRNVTRRYPLSISQGEISSEMGEYGCYREKIDMKKDSLFAKIEICVSTDEEFIIQLPLCHEKSDQTPYFIIPGFLYGTNNLKGSDGRQPKFDYGGKTGNPDSSLFYIRSDRSSHAAVIRIGDGICSMVSLDHVIHGINIPQKDKWSPAHLFTGLMLDTSNKDLDVTGFQIGYENAPYRYSWRKDQNVPGSDEKLFGYISGQSGKTLRLNVLYTFYEEKRKSGYGPGLRSHYNFFHQEPVKVGLRKEAIVDIGLSLIEHGYNRQTNIFCLSDDPDGIHIGDIAWTGGMQAAYPLLKAGYFLNHDPFKDTALQFIENLCHNAVHEQAGLFYEEFRDNNWQITGWWGTREDCFNFGDAPLHSAYLNGQCCYYLLKSYLLHDNKPELWLYSARRVLETVIRSQRADGAFGVFFDPGNGDAVDYDGFQGCWFASALALLYRITSQKEYLESAENALDHYYQWHLRGELYNTPMDTHKAVDQEGNLAFVAACRELHEITQKKIYVEYGLIGLDWEFSWKFDYNKVYSNNPLRGINWSSCGGSITSTHNPSIHQMGNLIAGDLYYFYLQTNDSYLKERLRDTCIWGLNAYNVNDGYLGFGKKGMATEQFTYTDGVVLPWPHPWDGGIWEANLPWAAACILLNCAENIPDRFFGE